jgi:hypothetical protein
LLKNCLARLNRPLFLVFIAFAAVPALADSVKPTSVVAAQPAAKPSEDIPFHGNWVGRFAGDSVGNITVTVGADGIAKVTCITDETGRTFELSGPVEASGAVTAIENSFGPAGIKVRFTGQLTRKGTASGTWGNAFFNLKGEWQATRKGNLLTAVAAAK